MGRPIKYSTTTTSGSYQKGNVAIAVNSINFGPTSTTGWYTGITPTGGNFVVTEVVNGAPPRFYMPTTEDEWVRLAKQEGATGDNTGSIGAVKSWFASQANYDVSNIELPLGMPNIVGDGLVLNLDASIVESYPIDFLANQTNLLYAKGLYTPGRGSSGFADLGLWVTESVIIPNSKFRISTGTVFRSGTEQSLRFYVPLNILNNYQSYNLSFNYQIISGSLFEMSDWNDRSITNVVNTNYGSYQYASATGISTGNPGGNGIYDNTYRFMDFRFGTGSIVDIWDIQLTQDVSASSFNTGSGTTWNDMSGLGSNGTLTNGPVFNANGNVIFDGTNDYMVFSSDTTRTNLGISNYFTFDVWIKANNQGDQFGWSGYTPYWGYTMRTAFTDSNTKIISYLYYQDSNGTWVDSYNQSGANAKGNVGKWVNLVITFDNGLVTHYANGNVGTSTTLALTGQNPTRNLGYGLIGWTSFNGKFAQGKVYNRVLSHAEILQNYYQAPIVTDSLVLAYDASNLISYDSETTTINDLTSYNNTGSLVNGTSFTKIGIPRFQLDGVDDTIYVPKDLNGFTHNIQYDLDWTIECWMYMYPHDGLPQHYVGIYGNYNGCNYTVYKGNAQGIVIYNANNPALTSINFSFGPLNNPTGSQCPNVSINWSNAESGWVAANVNKWCHFVMTSDDGTYYKIYVNGVQQGSTKTVDFKNSQLRIDNNLTSTSNYKWGGSGATAFNQVDFSIMRIYNKPLTSIEIEQNFNAQRSRFGI